MQVAKYWRNNKLRYRLHLPPQPPQRQPAPNPAGIHTATSQFIQASSQSKQASSPQALRAAS